LTKIKTFVFFVEKQGNIDFELSQYDYIKMFPWMNSLVEPTIISHEETFFSLKDVNEIKNVI
jgi:hypothetical protein